MIDRVEIAAKKELAEIRRIGAIVERFGATHALPERVIFRINLALDELLTNLINYGYHNNDGGRHDIKINLTLDDETLTAELRDNGCAFNPLEAPQPDLDLPLEDKPIGGLGIHFVLSVMDDVQYRREGGLNFLRMRQKLPKHEGNRPVEEPG